MIPGEVIPAGGVIGTLPGVSRVEPEVTDTDDRPVHVGSHVHVARVTA